MIRRPPRSTLDRSSAASDVYKRQGDALALSAQDLLDTALVAALDKLERGIAQPSLKLSLIHISEPTRPY